MEALDEFEGNRRIPEAKTERERDGFLNLREKK